MDLYREAIDKSEEKFVEMIAAIAQKKIFILEGESYKKNRYQGSEEQVGTWYNRKNIYLVDNRKEIEEIFDFDSLKQRLLSGFQSLQDIYFWLILLMDNHS